MGQWILLSFDPAPVCFYEVTLRRKPITHRHRKTKTSEIPDPRPLSRVSCAGGILSDFYSLQGCEGGPHTERLVNVDRRRMVSSIRGGLIPRFLPRLPCERRRRFFQHNLGLNLLQSLLFVIVSSPPCFCRVPIPPHPSSPPGLPQRPRVSQV